MRCSLALSVCFALTTLPATVLAQSPAARTPAPTRHPPEFLDRAYVDVDGSYQSHTFSFSDTRQDAWLQETASWTADYDVNSGPSLLVGGGVRVWRQLIVRAGYSEFSDTNAALITGTVPHPFFFNQNRSISGTEGALKQREDVIDIGAAWLIPINRRLDVRAFGGPSFFQLKRDLLTDVTYRDEYPYDTAEFSGVSRTQIKDSTVGFHVGADVTYRITGVLGVGGTVRYSHATFTLTSPADAASMSIDAGGLQVGGGLRLRFGGKSAKLKSPDTKKGHTAGSSSLPVPPAPEPAPAPEPTQPPAEAGGPPQPAAPPSGTEHRGTALITRQAYVYLLPDTHRTPLKVLEVGTRVKVLEETGEWLKIEFPDRQLGPRTGYVLRSACRY